ncbi:unnamed protein product [Mytilus edulis]|uniref:Uncharacterized protein n=1 Tax=Mytilus edulis TaxID=6550 RepID=A0A8S3RMQ8_MYTED|nr:unnamed protein product [Mytilus edulis]
MYRRDKTKRHKHQEVIKIAVCTDETKPNDTSIKKSSRLQYVPTRQNQTTQASKVIKIAVCTDETKPNDTSIKKSSRLQYVPTRQNQTTQASRSHLDCSMYRRDKTKRHKHQEVIKIAVCTDETKPNDTSIKKSSRFSMYRRDKTKRHQHQDVI